MSIPGASGDRNTKGKIEGQRSQKLSKEEREKGWRESYTHIPGLALLLPRKESPRNERREAYVATVCISPSRRQQP